MRCRRRRRVGLVKKGSEICARRRRPLLATDPGAVCRIKLRAYLEDLPGPYEKGSMYAACMLFLLPPLSPGRVWGRVAAPTQLGKGKCEKQSFSRHRKQKKKTRQRGEVGRRKRAWGSSGWRRQAGWRSLLYCGSRCSYCCVIPLLLFLALAWKKNNNADTCTRSPSPPHTLGRRSFIN